jgi:hypothetical protein
MFSDDELWTLAQMPYTDDDETIELIRFIRELRERRRNFPELAESIAGCDRRACEWLRGLLEADAAAGALRPR